MQQPKLSTIGTQLYYQLEQNEKLKITVRATGEAKVHVAGVASTITAAYEQLRNATENAEEHLVRQRAIRRFYARTLFLSSATDLGEDLIIELTEAGYIQNDTVALSVVERLNKTIAYHKAIVERADQADSKLRKWVLESLSVESDWLIGVDPGPAILANIAFKHFTDVIDKSRYETSDFEVSVYVAIHKVLLKSDLPTIRYDLIKLYKMTAKDMGAFREFNQKIDDLFSSRQVEHISRFVSRYGAPFFVLKSFIREHTNISETLPNRSKFLSAFEDQIQTEYKDARRRVNSGVVKSIIFLLITKALIGLAIEIPYDILIHGYIAAVPLAINLLFPPAYMALLRLGMTMPGAANAESVKQYIAEVLYESDSKIVTTTASAMRQRFSFGFNVFYALMFVLVFGFVGYLLYMWEFNIVQAGIFFVFLSTASFLGFRLSKIISDLEIITPKPSLFTIVRDFLYTPFVLLGQFISSRYSKLNIIAIALDVIIELPLKTILRLLRQWVAFLNAKKEEI